ncbi:MAG: SsrA-binding protein SmpB, partial [Pseudomonadota bacterium]
MNAKPKTKKGQKPALIADNRRARHDFFIEDTFEAGMQLEGWEVKSLREGRGQITESFVQIKNGEAWIFGSSITPLLSASSHVRPEPRRARKLLLHRVEIDRLVGAVERKGYTL